MDAKDAQLPPYAPVTDEPALLPRWMGPSRRRGPRQHRRAFRLIFGACLLFITFSQWRQLSPRSSPASSGGPGGPPSASLLSLDKLHSDLATCAALRAEPQDAPGLGRTKNSRFVDGQPPVLIRNATVWTGEPVAGTSAEDARAGKGYEWIASDVYLENGLIQRVEPLIDVASLSPATIVWDAHGRLLTAGLVDMHSHAGGSPLPELANNDDTNELSSDITPYVRSIDGIKPLDHQIQVIKSGGVTTSLILPGSGNNIGGEAYVIKHAVGPEDGRPEVSIDDMIAAPDARDLRYIKMACGENAKRVYGKAGQRGPYSRLGESWEFRHAFEQAAALVQAQDDWCALAETAAGNDARLQQTVSSYLPRDLEWETLAAVLRGQVRVNTHCYTIPDLEAFVDHTNEFKFPVWAFHHAHETYLVPEVLKRVWGVEKYGPPASAIFADNMFYKDEAYRGTEFAGKILWEHGLTPIYVSDNPVLNAQHVLFEAAKGYHFGLPYHAALAAVTTAPAERLGLGNRLGRVKPGFDADIVVWDSDPLSVGATPVQVWIDGYSQYDSPVELDKPITGPMKTKPYEASAAGAEPTPEEVTEDVVFTGVTHLLMPGSDVASGMQGSLPEPVNVVVSRGLIACVGACQAEIQHAKESDSKSRIVELENGYITPGFTAFGAHLGLNEIEAEQATDNGASSVFSRAVDGLTFGGKKLATAHKYGLTRAISAPQLQSGFSHYGTSAGFLTGALHGLSDGAIFAADAAVHYSLGLAGKQGSTPSLSSGVGSLRSKLLKALSTTATSDTEDPYAEAIFLRQVVSGELPLAITAHSADSIATILKVKAEVEAAAAAQKGLSKTPEIRLVILGGAESYLVAKELAAAHVGVVLAPLQPYAKSWEQRRALTGAPLTNGTAIDILLDAGVVVALGLEEDWLIRDMPLLAGIAYKNGDGRLTEKAAIDLVSTNVYKLLGLKSAETPLQQQDHFVVFEGSPLEIGSKIKAVAGGLGHLTVL